MPWLSNWKTPSVLPAWKRANVAGSSSGTASRSTFYTEVLQDELEGVPDDGQVPEAQEVHLQQADGLDILHRELGGDVALDRLVERHELDEGLWV